MNFLTEDKIIKARLAEVLSEIPAAKELDINVALKKEGKGLSLSYEGDTWSLCYEDTSALMRGTALLAQRAAKGITEPLAEERAFSTLGIMADMSGNAAMKPEAIKRFCRLISSEGYNALLLKTVSGAVVTKDIDFAGLCGRYSVECMRELDEYADSLGIELVPYVQFSELPVFASVEDFGDVVDNALCEYSENLKSRKLCLGFDRPALPGCGPYPAPMGNCPEEKIASYVETAEALCEKYGYTLTMGSGVLSGMERAGKNTTMAVSECTSVNRDTYSGLLDGVAEKVEKVGFVGGDNGWYGATPLSWLAHTVNCNTLPVLLEKMPNEVYVAMWRDDTGACSFFATLPTIFEYGEICWARTNYTEHLSQRMLAHCGVDFYDMVPLEDIPAIRCRMHTGRVIVSPGRYLLYDRPISGDFHAHSTGGYRHLANITVWMAERIERAGEFAPIFEEQVAFSNILNKKSQISEFLRRNYKKGEREVIQKLYDKGFDEAIAAIDEYLVKLRARWDKECMDFGMKLIEERAELVKTRILEDKPILGDYLSGKTDKIDAFEGDLVPYAYEEGLIHDRTAILLNSFDMIIKGNN